MKDDNPFHIENAHIWLKRYRAVEVFIILFFIYLAYRQWLFFETEHTKLVEWALAGFVSMNATIIGAIMSALKSVNTRHEKDD